MSNFTLLADEFEKKEKKFKEDQERFWRAIRQEIRSLVESGMAYRAIGKMAVKPDGKSYSGQLIFQVANGESRATITLARALAGEYADNE